MNILYIGYAQGFDNADKFYLIPQKLINGFTRNGHTVYVFNDRDYTRASNIFGSSKLGHKKLNEKILDICRVFEPDLIVLGHCKHVTNQTLEKIREILKNVKIIYRNVDPLHTENNVSDIRYRLGSVDGVFITTAGEVLKQFANPRSFVCFMPNPIDASIETGRAFESDCTIDLFFAGGALRHQHDQRSDLLTILTNELQDLRLGFYGTGALDQPIFGRHYIKTLSNSRMGLCLNKTEDFYLYASDRMAQYLGNGVFTFISRSSGFQDIFAEDEVGFYASNDELIDRIRYLASNDEKRRIGAQKAWQRSHEIFDTKHVTSYMVEKTFDMPLSRDYIWPETSF